ncbi:hypothetical protein BKA65DRAFT_93544 [Rhexocercosporidium sp. MPI-PUGE-AT-0058]|nr:hypothetical protein BKA65DRAFT_93544 [Rhexocercosporidium sp. MPI-PUGE-AT-0058]
MTSDEERSLKGRAGKPKVRTGCRTCKYVFRPDYPFTFSRTAWDRTCYPKIQLLSRACFYRLTITNQQLTNYRHRRRKVKCDEAKPGCFRCLKFGTECEGYRPKRSEQSMKPTKVLSAHKERLLLPNFTHQALRRASEPIPRQPRLYPALQLKGGLEDQQFLRLKDVSTETPLARFCREDLHNTTLDHRLSPIPYSEPTIQQLKHSIAALSRAKTSERSGDSAGFAATHFNYAFLQYGRALEGIREIASSTETRHTKVLLYASILIFIFESIQCNSIAAIAHMKSAYSALVTRDPSLKSFALAKIIEDINEKSSLNEIFLQLRTLNIYSAAPPSAYGSMPSSFG